MFSQGSCVIAEPLSEAMEGNTGEGKDSADHQQCGSEFGSADQRRKLSSPESFREPHTDADWHRRDAA